MTPERETLAVDGHEVTLWRGGAGAPLVVLHDVLGPLWEGLPDRLARRRTVVLPSLLGFPGSTYREDLDTMEDLAFWTLALFEQRGLRGADVVAEGYGGWIAAEVATRWPDAIGRLVLVSPMGLRLAAAPPKALFELRGPALRAMLFGDPESALAQRLVPDLPSSMEEIELKLTADRAAARFAWRPYLHNPKLAGRLGRVKSPTLILWGAANRLLAPAYAEAWRSGIAGAEVEIVPEGGHMVGMEQSDQVAARIEAFFRR
jgi:pimeloyl-ACP methyl ester carboxylesterase